MPPDSSSNSPPPPPPPNTSFAWILLAIAIGTNVLFSIHSANSLQSTLLSIGVNITLCMGTWLTYKQLKQAKADFIRKENQMQFIFNSTPIGLHWSGQRKIDGKMKVKDRIHNPAHQLITGLSDEEMEIPGIFEKITHPEDAKKQKEIRKSLDSRETNKFSMEKRYIRLDGKTVWVLASWERQWDLDGQGYQEVSSMLDITTLKETSENLSQKESQLRFIFESIPIGLMWSYVEPTVPGKPPKFHERLINPAHHKITGLTKETADTPGIFDKISYPEDIKKQKEGLRAIKRKETNHFSMEKRYIHPNGEVHWVSISWIRIWEEGEKRYKEISTLVDITEQKKISEEIANAKIEAEEANNAKSQFLATMSHEIRTPMNGLLGVLHIMEPNVPTNCEKYLKIAQNSANDLLDLINDILDFSKIEAGKLQIEKSKFAVNDLIEEVTEIHANNAFEKGLEFYCHITPEATVEIENDAHKIRQVISNLISNAIKFTSTGGIEVGAHSSQLSNKKEAIEIYVRDSGIGIDDKTQKELFNPFTQANASTKRKYGGTGLGLSICRGIIENLGGEIGIESKKNTGSTFWIRVPIEKKWPIKNLTTPLPNNKYKRALIIENNRSISNYLDTWLTLWGCLVESAGNLQQYHYSKGQRSEHVNYDVVFIDSMIFAAQPKEWESIVSEDNALLNSKVVMLDLLTNNKFGTPPQGIDASLSKPIRLQQFQSILTENNSPQTDHTPKKTCQVTDFSKYSILVVDDNLTNRLIAKDLLKQRHLITADQANNGKEAVEAIKKSHYDLVLMDCMMPDMDGYEATQAIRNGTAGPENKDLTIIAFTANSSKEDREKCFEQGMDDHLSKPIVPDSLKKVLDKWLGQQPENQRSNLLDEDVIETTKEIEEEEAVDINDIINTGTPAPLLDNQSIYNPNRLESMYGSDKTTIGEMLNLFLETAQEEMKDLHQAIENPDDLEQIRFYAHRMKGSAANFGAERLSALSLELENLSVAGEKDAALKKYNEVYNAAQETFKTMEKAAHCCDN